LFLARVKSSSLLIVLLSGGFFACSSGPTLESGSVSSDRQLDEISLEDIYSETGETIGCKGMLDSYCKYLYSPIAQGNVKIGRGRDSLLVLQGRTPNDFTSVYYAYSKAKLRAQSVLPIDFREALNSHDYFHKLSLFLGRKPRQQMSMRNRLQSIRTDSELDGIWHSAIAE